jgi:hypothetical protein
MKTWNPKNNVCEANAVVRVRVRVGLVIRVRVRVKLGL